MSKHAFCSDLISTFFLWSNSYFSIYIFSAWHQPTYSSGKVIKRLIHFIQFGFFRGIGIPVYTGICIMVGIKHWSHHIQDFYVSCTFQRTTPLQEVLLFSSHSRSCFQKYNCLNGDFSKGGTTLLSISMHYVDIFTEIEWSTSKGVNFALEFCVKLK